MALDARRLDRLAAALRGAPDRAGALAYCLRVAQSLVPDRRFRDAVLRLLVELHGEGGALLGGSGSGSGSGAAGASSDVRAVAQCLVALDDAPALAALLTELLRSANGDEDVALALQVAFDLHEAEEGPFAARVLAAMEEAAPKRPFAPPPVTPAGAATAEAGGDAMESDEAAAPGAPGKAPSSAEGGPSSDAAAAAAALAAAAPAAEAAPVAAPPQLSPEDAAHRDALDVLSRVLSGAAPTSLALEFMHSAAVAGSADSTALLRARQAVEPRNSVCHGAVRPRSVFSVFLLLFVCFFRGRERQRGKNSLFSLSFFPSKTPPPPPPPPPPLPTSDTRSSSPTPPRTPGPPSTRSCATTSTGSPARPTGPSSPRRPGSASSTGATSAPGGR